MLSAHESAMSVRSGLGLGVGVAFSVCGLTCKTFGKSLIYPKSDLTPKFRFRK